MLLAGPALGFRLLGALGVGRFATWRACAAHGLAAMLVVTAVTHFARPGAAVPLGHDDPVAMVPPFVPFPGAAVYATGVLELLGAVGLVRASTRLAAGVGLAVLLVLMLPANIHAAVGDVVLDGGPATPLWFGIPEQVLFVAVALWAATARDGASRGGPPAAALPGPGGTGPRSAAHAPERVGG